LHIEKEFFESFFLVDRISQATFAVVQLTIPRLATQPDQQVRQGVKGVPITKTKSEFGERCSHLPMPTEISTAKVMLTKGRSNKKEAIKQKTSRMVMKFLSDLLIFRPSM
jgi:hypothetical protein